MLQLDTAQVLHDGLLYGFRRGRMSTRVLQERLVPLRHRREKQQTHEQRGDATRVQKSQERFGRKSHANQTGNVTSFPPPQVSHKRASITSNACTAPPSPGYTTIFIVRPNTRRSIRHRHGRPSGPVSALPRWHFQGHHRGQPGSLSSVRGKHSGEH